MPGDAHTGKSDVTSAGVMNDNTSNEVGALGAADPLPGRGDPGPDPDTQHVTDSSSVSNGYLVTEGNQGDALASQHEPDNNKPGEGIRGEVALSPEELTSKLSTVNTLLGGLTSKSSYLEGKVEDLCASLEFSQKEIADLKAENTSLRRRLEEVGTEEERSHFQMKSIEDKLDKVETYGKKKNLIVEGLQEAEGGREDIEKIVRDLLDQLNLDRGIEFDACYRVGGLSRNRTRPILLSFLKQADRELVYMRRMELRKTANYAHVWINEDLGTESKKTRNMVRLITKQAHLQGVDHKAGKYAIHIDRTRYDDKNFDELPTALRPASLKQIKLDGNTIAYQSEHAPFTNFFPSKIEIGRQTFISAEQAFQFLHAKTMNKMLATTRIYLERDPREIKKMGDDLGTSDEWEAKKFDFMYAVLKKKFEQNFGSKESADRIMWL